VSDDKPIAETIDIFWLMKHEPDIHDGVLDELCRGYLEDGVPIPESMLPLIAQRFRDFRARLVATAQGRKSGAQKVPRTMAVMIALQGASVDQAAEAVAKTAGIQPDSARTEFYRWVAEKNSKQK
jgi:hypothetical protein